MQVVSINAAKKQVIQAGGKSLETGIFKQPIEGSVSIGALGIESDIIVDTRVHGGEDQALYLYSQEDYNWWSSELGKPISPGTFGENITVSSFPDQPLKIGDRLTINQSVVLEITAPRVPCLKLASRMEDPAFGKKFVAAVRPGAYARVISVGTLRSGDSISWEQTTNDYATVNEVFVEWHKKDWSEAVFKKALNSPISKIARGIIEQRYMRD